MAPVGTKPSTLAEALARRAEREPDRVACSFLDDALNPVQTLTYASLDGRARAIASCLSERHCRGERALLLYPPGLDFVEAFFGCAYAGAIAVPVDVPRPRRGSPRLDSVARDARPALVLTTPDILDPSNRIAAGHPLRQSAQWIATAGIGDSEADAWRAPACVSEDVALLQYTSGSTSAPKGAVVTHRNVLVNSERIGRAFGHSPDSRVASWLPHFHDMGLIGAILHPIVGGIPTTLMSPMTFIQRPVRWLQMIAAVGATSSGAPNFAYELCVQRVKPEARADLDLSSWAVAFNGAEPVRLTTLERFASTFAECGFRREALFPCYGLAEATLLVAGGPKGIAPRARPRPQTQAFAEAPGSSRSVVSCGPCTDPSDVVIVDPETLEAQPPGRIGEIWLRGPCVARGYWEKSDGDASRFGARLPGFADGAFLRTGDLGFFVDAELHVSGRLGDVIIVAGAKHHPVDIEISVDACHPWVPTGPSVAFGVEGVVEECVVVAVELERREWVALRAGEREAAGGLRTSRTSFPADRLVGDIRGAVLRDHGVRVHDVVLLPPGALPRTTSGKVQRRDCVKAYRNGNWPKWRRKEREELTATVRVIEGGLSR